MFSNNMQLVIYVEDVEKSADFWKKIGFIEIDRQKMEETQVIEIATSPSADCHFVLYDRSYFEKYAPESITATPAILFSSDDVVSLYKKLSQLQVTMGELIQTEEQLVFNFVDNDGNFFAVSGN